MTASMAPYTSHFFAATGRGSNQSAQIVVPMIMNLVEPKSVVDVGCGTAGWLLAFRHAGVTDVLGIDGDWVPTNQLQIPDHQFAKADLTQPLRLGRTFDLVLSLEVAEHLPTSVADEFVSSLTQLAPSVLFSAAIPYQGGTGHINEQWPSYWCRKFEEHGFVAIDCMRPRLWSDARVESYYAQNMFLFVRRDRLHGSIGLRAESAASRLQPVDVVHPSQYMKSRTETVGPRTLIRAMPSAVVRTLRRILRNGP